MSVRKIYGTDVTGRRWKMLRTFAAGEAVGRSLVTHRPCDHPIGRGPSPRRANDASSPSSPPEPRRRRRMVAERRAVCPTCAIGVARHAIFFQVRNASRRSAGARKDQCGDDSIRRKASGNEAPNAQRRFEFVALAVGCAPVGAVEPHARSDHQHVIKATLGR
jgi:hypothetical protein